MTVQNTDEEKSFIEAERKRLIKEQENAINAFKFGSLEPKVNLSNRCKVGKDVYDTDIHSIPIDITWEDLKRGRYSHEYYHARHPKNDNSAKLFIDIDYYLKIEEEDFNNKLLSIKQALNFGSLLYNFVYTNGSFYDENKSKLSFHIIYQDKYIDIKNFNVKDEVVVDIVRKSFKNLNEELVDKLIEKMDNSLYTNYFFRLPYGKQDEKAIHYPQPNTSVDKYFVGYVKPSIEEINYFGKKKEATPRSEKPKVVKQDTDDKTKRAEEMLEMLKVVKKERFDKYDEWLKLLCLMKHNGLDKKDFILFSKESGHAKFSEENCLEHWYKLKERDNNVGFITIQKWLEEDGVNWKEMFCKKKNKLISDLLKAYNSLGVLTERTITPIFFEHYNDSLYYTALGWIHYDERKGWRIGDDDSVVYPLMKLLGDKFDLFVNSMKLKEGEDKKDFSKRQQALKKEVIRLSSYSFCNKVIKTAKVEFFNKDIIMEFDNKPSWFCFDNFKAIDMMTGNVIDIKKEDKIITTCGYLIPERIEQDVLNAKEFLQTVVEEKNFNSFMSMISSNFYGNPNKHQNVYIHTGSGGNGKSLVASLISNTLKNYAGLLPIEQITRDSKGRCDPNSSMVSMRGKRYAQLNEPEDCKNTTLKVARVKELSGESKIKARDLNSKAFDMYITFTLNILCNEKPKLSRPDEGIERRIKVFNYPYKFVDEPEENNPFQKKKDINMEEKCKNDKAFQNGFLYLCLDFWRQNEGKFISTDDVKEASTEYMRDNNPLVEWLKDYEESDTHLRQGILYKQYTNENGEDISQNKFSYFLEKLKVKIVKDKSNGNKIFLRKKEIIQERLNHMPLS